LSLTSLPLNRIEIKNNIEIHYAEAGVGQPLIFVHGGMGDWQSWAPQWEAFVPHFRCISYSRRFSSPNRNQLHSTAHSVVDEAEDFAELIDAWHAAPAILVGTSYGAYTALALALRWPDKVRALALTEPPVLPFADRVPGGQEAREAFERDVLRPSDKAFAAGRIDDAIGILTGGINGRDSEAMSEAGLAGRRRNAQAMRALALSSEAYPALDLQALAALEIPTLLLRGERTQAIHRAVSSALAALMPQTRTIEVPSAGHGVHRDNPVLFNAVVLRFLAAQPVALPDLGLASWT
jgi:pimeloyl-ACP methyl ester carboxylesterase